MKYLLLYLLHLFNTGIHLDVYKPVLCKLGITDITGINDVTELYILETCLSDRNLNSRPQGHKKINKKINKTTNRQTKSTRLFQLSHNVSCQFGQNLVCFRDLLV